MAGGLGYDLRTYFLPAAQATVAGGSPYDVVGYVYSPLIALLLAPVVDAEDVAAYWAVGALFCCVIAVAAVTAANSRALNAWQRPAFFGFAAVTLLYNWPLTLELWIGQTDLFVLAALSLSSLAVTTSRPWLAGPLLAVAALVKSWPAGAAVWLFRRGARQRLRTIVAALGTGVAALVLTAVALGPREIGRWLSATVAAGDQELLIFSVWGVGRHLFGQTVNLDPIATSPAIGVGITVVLLAAVGTLLAIVLLRPGDDQLSQWHTVCCTLLLLPVSHLVYFLLGLPMIWIWFGRVLVTRGKRPRDVIVFAVLMLWWLVAFRYIWPGDTAVTLSTTGYSVIMAVTLIAVGTSVVAEAGRTSDQWWAGKNRRTLQPEAIASVGPR